MVILAKLFLFAAAVTALPDPMQPAAVIQKRDYAQVTKDLSALSSSVSVLSTVITKYQGGLSSAIPIQSAVSSVGVALKKATSDSNAGPQGTSSQASFICGYFKNNLQPGIKGVLGALVGKKTQLKAAGISSIVNSDLTSLSAEARSLAVALSAKGTVSTSCGSSALSVVTSLFNSAISAFAAS